MKLGVDKNVWNYSWPASHIIVCSDEAEMSLYNFIIPLRAYYRSIDELRPIVLLVRTSLIKKKEVRRLILVSRVERLSS